MIAEQHKTTLRGEPDVIGELLERNREWARCKTKDDPGFFARLVEQQAPQFLWIGCSDSRVPATEIVDLDPGEMFVHRNIANLMPAGDTNSNAALLFAVDVLRVRHVLIVGHYCCGGIRAARGFVENDAIGSWLRPVRATCWKHRGLLNALANEHDREDRLCELNVIAQVEQVCANPIVRNAWRTGRDLIVHGLIYAIADGLLSQVCDPVAAAATHTADTEPDDDWNIW